jgi:hypothetical protein
MQPVITAMAGELSIVGSGTQRFSCPSLLGELHAEKVLQGELKRGERRPPGSPSQFRNAHPHRLA